MAQAKTGVRSFTNCTNVYLKNIDLLLQASSTEAELRRTVDDSKRLNSQLQQVEQENNQLRVSFYCLLHFWAKIFSTILQERVKQLELGQLSAAPSIGADISVSRLSSFTLMHVGLAVILALIVGLILGKIF